MAIDPNHKGGQNLPDSLETSIDTAKASEEDIKDIFAASVASRILDEKLLTETRKGDVSTLPPSQGHEIAQTAPMYALSGDNMIFPYYRDNALQFARNSLEGPLDDVPMFDALNSEELSPEGADNETAVVQQAMADVAKHYAGIGNYVDTGFKDTGIMVPDIVVGSHMPLAVGYGWASRLDGGEEVSFVSFGDGATSEGDFHEAMNFAGVFDAQTIFYCQNNEWAISTPREKQTKADSIAEMASAYGMEGIQIDGDDPYEVFETVQEAEEKARNGNPILIEAMTTRLGPHSNSDDDTVYRDERPEDPLEDFTEYMLNNGILEKEEIERIEESSEALVDSAYEEAKDMRSELQEELEEKSEHMSNEELVRMFQRDELEYN